MKKPEQPPKDLTLEAVVKAEKMYASIHRAVEFGKSYPIGKHAQAALWGKRLWAGR